MVQSDILLRNRIDSPSPTILDMESPSKRKVALSELMEYRKRMCIGTVSLTFAYRLVVPNCMMGAQP